MWQKTSAIVSLCTLLSAPASAQVGSWLWPAKHGESAQAARPNIDYFEMREGDQAEPVLNPQNAKVVETYRNRVLNPVSVTASSRTVYEDGASGYENHDGWFPITPQDVPCESDGTGIFPDCTFANGGFGKTNTSSSLEAFYKSGISQTGAAWSYDIGCYGPGDCLGLSIGGEAISSTPAGADEGFVALGTRVFDSPTYLPSGTTTAALTAGQTTLNISSQFKEKAVRLAEHGYIVFNDVDAPGYSRLDGNDGLGTGVGGVEDFNQVDQSVSKTYWKVNVASEIPSAVRYDPAIGWTGHCFTLDKTLRELRAEAATWYYWLPIIFGPTDTAAGTGSPFVCAGTSCASDQFETYLPALGDNIGAPAQYVANKIWTDFATDSATDDGIIAPCEIVSHPIYSLDPATGFIKDNSVTQVVLRKPAKSGRTIASGTDWVFGISGTPSQYLPVKFLAESRFGSQALVSSIPLPCTGSEEECVPFGAGFMSVGFKLPTGQFLQDVHYKAQGRAQSAVLYYRPWAGDGAESAEQAPMLWIETDNADWGHSTNGDRIPIALLRGQSSATDFKSLYDSADGRYLHSRTGIVSQVAEVREDPVTYFVTAGTRDCSDVCEARKLICDSWKLVSNVGALSHQTNCETDPTEQGAYCHCDSPET